MLAKRNPARRLEEEGSIRPMDVSRRQPNYLPWKPKFYCPLSPQILWFHDLRYSECPLIPSQRDMNECASCPCRSDNTAELIADRERREKESRRKRKGSKGDTPRSSRRPRNPSVVVREKGKSYVSP